MEEEKGAVLEKIRGWAQQKWVVYVFNMVSLKCGWAQQQKWVVHLEFLLTC